MARAASHSLTIASSPAPLLCKRSPSPLLRFSPLHITSKFKRFTTHAWLGGEKDVKRAEKKFITREEEPDQYWQTAGEREGENPMKTPLPYIIIFGMSTPFVILAIAFANGWIKIPVR